MEFLHRDMLQFESISLGELRNAAAENIKQANDKANQFSVITS